MQAHPKAPLSGPRSHDGARQLQSSPTQPSPQLNFAGSSAADDSVADLGAVSPADAVMDVGAGHVVQMVNSVLQVWDTAGNQQLAPIATTSLFEGIGGQCGGGGFNAVDGVVRFDELSGRFVLAFIPYDFNFASPFAVCVAVSASSDPTGSWNAYEYDSDVLLTNPRMGVWPDAYYLSFDALDSGFNNAGVTAFAFDRSAMIAGNETAAAVQFSSSEFFSLVPADLDGSATPPEGAPNPQASPGEANWDGSPSPVLHMFQFHVDFETPENSSFDGPFDVSVPDFNPIICGGGFNPCIPTLGGEALFANAGILMNGMQYRNFGDHESLVVSQTVNVSEDGDQAGVRWYEVRPNAASQQGGPAPYSLFQSGTYAPTATNRWVPSIAMDVSGDIAMGYSISDATIHPEIGLTGRLSADPLGVMGSEIIMTAGAGSQATGPYWGNFTGMVVDPADGCTFWYTNQYYDTNDDFNWLTRIGSFKYPSCTSGPSGTLQGTVTDGTNPIAGATVTAGASSTQTNAAGAYVFTLPVGTYDMAVSKFGYLPTGASGVSVADGGTTIQDFVMAAAPSTLVNGTVKDGSGAGWPLGSNITITAPGAPTFHATSDPVTGYYEYNLVEGIVYNFSIIAVAPGYLPGGGQLDLSSTAQHLTNTTVKNWTLQVDVVACNAPGYSPENETVFSENFNGGELPDGWTSTNDTIPGPNPGPLGWIVATDGAPCDDYFPTDGNMTGGDGSFAVANSDCLGNGNSMDTSLISPPIDLSAAGAAIIQFNEDYLNLGDTAAVDFSTNGGSSWTNVLSQTASVRGPALVSAELAGAAGHANTQIRFHYYNANWAWWWQVDNVAVFSAACVPGAGGLVVGNVTSLQTGAGLNGATVANTGGGSTKTATAPGQGDGYYTLFAGAGSQTFEASLNQYGSVQHSALVVPGAAQRIDFALPSGKLTAAPTEFNIRLAPNGTQGQTLNLTNSGSVSAGFHLRELNVPFVPPALPTGPFVDANTIKALWARLPKYWAKEMRASGRLDASRLPKAGDRQKGLVMDAGDVLATYPASFATPNGLPFGVMFDPSTTNFYISNVGAPFPGDNNDYQFTADGTETGVIINTSPLGLIPGDGAFNSQTGMGWQVFADLNGGSVTCVFEFSPSTGELTGNTICPAFSPVQTALAYNVNTNTFYSSSFNDGIIWHFDTNGVVLDSFASNTAASGLAFNALTGHLFAFDQLTFDIVVMDPANGYNTIGEFAIGAPGISSSPGGLEMDCAGHLIAVDQNAPNPILIVDSGEVGGAECHFINTIPWVSENPTDGVVPGTGGAGAGSNVLPIAVQFDASGLLPGLRQAQFTFTTDTPNPLPPVPLSLVVKFLDVPDNNQFQSYIYAAAGAGVMIGGPPSCPQGVLYFCPSGVVSRADMAGYLFRAIHGSQTPPPVYQNIFTDVTFNQYNSFYIQGIYDDHITAGCGDGTTYCPDSANTRAQMAVFIWKGLYGDQAPPSCSGIFADVPCPSTFADYIEAIYALNITGGCGTNPLIYCPNNNITNGQMATFLVKAFNLPYLP
ncbi:MAG TPA: carboxypeptidase regulatory-like domain-containing protein [Thermoanaerobaculia bacterium]|nr:carboxypeptidase regulatory-like domain-containing protein [Thermoanaerobaculia bacterium]